MLGSLFGKSKTFLFLAAMLLAAYFLGQWNNEAEIIRVNGQKARIIDGDSFKTGETEFRIYGIDAPEYMQICKNAKGDDWRCGVASRRALEKMLRGEQIDCEVRAKDRFGRNIVTCSNAKIEDLGAHLVERGLAISGDNFDDVIYGGEEARAEKAGRGIWAGKFTHPKIWREQHPHSHERK